jgi:thiol:disulfide interchange protein DsbG
MLRQNTPPMESFTRPHRQGLDRPAICITLRIVWVDAAGTVRMKPGMPRLSPLPAITGLPARNIDDPGLAEFR